MSPDIEHLIDHVELFGAAIEARHAQTQGRAEEARVALHRMVGFQERIVAREQECATLATVAAFDRLGLSESERHVLWFLGALSMQPHLRALVRAVAPSFEDDPTLNEIRQIVHGAAPSLAGLADLAPTASLRRLALIERCDTRGPVHDTRQTWALSARVLAVLHGNNALDPSLARFARITHPIARDKLVADERTCELLGHAVTARNVAVLAGARGVGRRTMLLSVARDRGLEVLDVDARALAHAPELEDILRCLARECRLLGRVPSLSNLDALEEAKLDLVDRTLIMQLDGPVLATCGVDRPTLRWSAPVVFVDAPLPSTKRLATLWQRQLGQVTLDEAEALAARYPLAPALIHHAALAARAHVADGELSREDINAGVRAVLDDRLGQFARRTVVTQNWDDMVLPYEQLEAVSELISRVRGRGRVIEEWGFGAKVGKGLGVSALFSGPPGTGKTMLAALIAQELGLELYQVDLGKVVSKWVGETEKNLGALFDAAEAGHAVLLFDEADALFGKRTEVKSSNDRHANLETNYLLQRLESFSGVCLLTTNHDSHIDPAFQRRLSLHLRIELPDVAERAELWRTMLPPAAPVSDGIDFEALARRYAMSGGYIRNAVLRAAFVAADRGKSITHEALERAAHREYEAMGKIVCAV